MDAKVYTAQSTQHYDFSGSSCLSSDDYDNPAVGLLLHAFPAEISSLDPLLPEYGDNKSDILTQSQMLRTPDSDKFIQCQADEIASFYDLDGIFPHFYFASLGTVIEVILELP